MAHGAGTVRGMPPSEHIPPGGRASPVSYWLGLSSRHLPGSPIMDVSPTPLLQLQDICLLKEMNSCLLSSDGGVFIKSVIFFIRCF